MKTLKNSTITAVLFLLCLLSAVSCGKKDDNENPAENINNGTEQTENNEEKPKEDIRIAGTVISVTYNSEGIADFLLLTENDAVCRVSPAALSQNSVEVGQEVLVTAEGSVMEADPMQAVAKSVDVTAEFNKMPLPVEIYKVYDITASKVSEALTSSGFRFYRFSTYEECLDFLEENELSAEFEKAVGNTDITALTDTFFEKNDLGLFIVNSAEEQGNQSSGVFHSNKTLYLAIDRTSENAVLVNTKFDAFLMPLNKNTEISKGIVLIKHYLKPSNGEDQGKDNEDETVQTNS